MPEYKSPQNEPGMDKNILLIFLLMAIAIFGAQFYMKKYAPQQKSTAQPVQQPIQPGAVSSQPAAAQATPSPAAPNGPSSSPLAPPSWPSSSHRSSHPAAQRC